MCVICERDVASGVRWSCLATWRNRCTARTGLCLYKPLRQYKCMEQAIEKFSLLYQQNAGTSEDKFKAEEKEGLERKQS